jgi:hypothetical protein
LQALTQRWSRIMQKLSVVTNLQEGSKGVPVLSKKRISENWKGSAAVSILTGAFASRPTRRLKGIDQESFRDALGETLQISTTKQSFSTENLNTYLGKDKGDRIVKLEEVWEKVFEAGGTEFSIPGHELYMQATIRNNQKMFMIGDPLIDKYKFLTMEEMEKYARKVKKGKLTVRPDVLEGRTPAGLILGDDVPIYTNPIKLGMTDPKFTKSIGYSTVVKEAKLDTRSGKQWAKVIVTQDNGEEMSGWVEPEYVKIF